MNIQTRLQINALIAIALTLVLGAILFLVGQQLSSDNVSNTAIAKGNFLLALFVILLVSLMLGIIGLTNISIGRPLKRLSRAIQEISQGKLDVAFDDKLLQSQDEIGQLARTFDELLSKLAVANQTLEKRVAEKTEKLQAQLVELEKMYKLMVGRELKMIEMKKEMELLRKAKDE